MSDKATSGNEYGDAPWRDEEILRELYVERGMTTVEVGNELGCADVTVSNWLKKFDIEVAPSVAEANPDVPDAARDPDLIRELYVEQDMSVLAIAGEIGCSDTPIRTVINEHGMEKRRPWRDEQTLRRLHLEEELAPGEIANELGCSFQTVTRWIGIHDIPQKRYYPRTARFLHDEEDLRERYVGREMSVYDIADEAGCTSKTVCNWLARHDIEARSIKGENHYAWNGGVGRYYGPSWPTQRKAAIERDGGECRMCSMTAEEHYKQHGTDIHVHHLCRFASFEDSAVANRLENLVTLCFTCHNEAERIAPLLPDVR